MSNKIEFKVGFVSHPFWSEKKTGGSASQKFHIPHFRVKDKKCNDDKNDHTTTLCRQRSLLMEEEPFQNRALIETDDGNRGNPQALATPDSKYSSLLTLWIGFFPQFSIWVFDSLQNPVTLSWFNESFFISFFLVVSSTALLILVA